MPFGGVFSKEKNSLFKELFETYGRRMGEQVLKI